MSASAFITLNKALKEDFKGRTNYWLCRPEITAAQDLQICRAVIPPGEGHPFHRHPELEEALYVLEGSIEQWVMEEKQIMHPGDLVHVPRNRVHATFNAGTTDATILAILSPAKTTGPFLVDVSEEAPWNTLRSVDT